MGWLTEPATLIVALVGLIGGMITAAAALIGRVIAPYVELAHDVAALRRRVTQLEQGRDIDRTWMRAMRRHHTLTHPSCTTSPPWPSDTPERTP